MKRTATIFSALVILTGAASCQKESGMSGSKEREIKVRIGDDIELKSASAQSNGDFLFSVPFVTESGDTLSIEAYIGDNVDMPSAAITKGAPVTTSNIGTLYGSFKLSAYKDGSIYSDEISGGVIDGVTVTKSGDSWSLANSPYYWPEDTDDELTFCSSAPVGDGTGVSGVSWDGGSKLAFSYSMMPSAAVEGVYNDAVNQKDIVFAIDTHRSSDAPSGDVSYAEINFSHALTAVKFIRGDIDGCTVKSVSMNNFKGAGSAEAVKNTTSGDSRSLKFTWTPSGDLKTYVQTFNNALGEIGAEGSVADGGSIDPTTDQSCTFMMVPQELDATSGVSIVVAYGSGTEQTISVNLGSITAEAAGTEGNAEKLKDWSTYAGKVITIKINRAGVAVAVDETFSGATKSNVGAKNTGGKVEFVRAAVVANWVDADNNVYDTCDLTEEGTLTGGSGWTLHTDGFYYYTKAINPGAVTAGKIFTSYTAPATAPDTGLHLEIVVIAQGVEYDASCAKARAAWGLPDGILTPAIE